MQWVPHGYGRRSLNLAFCAWVLRRARMHGDRVEVMVHEAYLAFDSSRVRQSGAALVHRLMLTTLFAAASCVWLATPSFEPYVRPYGLGQAARVPLAANAEPAGPHSGPRARGSCRQTMDVAGDWSLRHVQPARDRRARTGHRAGARGATRCNVAADRPRWRAVRRRPRSSRCRRWRIGSSQPAPISADAVSAHVLAADVFVQPYPDGVTARRTTTTALLVHGRAIVTTDGHLTESFWRTDAGVRLVL